MKRIKIPLLFGIAITIGGMGPGEPPHSPRVLSSAAQTRPYIVRAGTANLRDYARFRAGDDWSPALTRALRDAGTVYVPRGKYTLRKTVFLNRDSTRLYGDGAASELVMLTPGLQILEANRTGEKRLIREIVVEELGFVGKRSPWTFALQSVDCQRIRFRRNTVRDIGAFRSVYVGPSASRFSSDVEVEHNTADGGKVTAGTFGILIDNTRRASVRHNTIRSFDKGIQWWGGAANPQGPHYSSEKFAGDLLIEENDVHHTSAAIWGSNGRAIVVRANRVSYCQDVCLDAEGSEDVQFVRNTARYAGTAVLAIFYHSSNIRFEENIVEQAGGFAEHPDQPAGRSMFESRHVSRDPAKISVVLKGNQFTYSAADGVGVLRNHALRRIELLDNTLTNTVVRLTNSPGGAVKVVGNRVLMRRKNLGEKPISVGGSTATGVELSGNQVVPGP